jgi:anti-anti-sigma factor
MYIFRVSSPPSQLMIESRTDANEVRLIVRGEVDLASALVLERELQRAEGSSPIRIVLDLGELGFIDSAGLSCLIRAQQRAKSNGRPLVFTRIPAQARRLFQLTGFDVNLIVD